MTKRENMFKTVRFERPDYIPMTFAINDACWENYPQEALFELMEQHPFLFPDFQKPTTVYLPNYAEVAQKGRPYTDDWGCVWETSMDGITGTVTKHPLADWAAFEGYTAPNPNHFMGIGAIDWAEERKAIELQKANGSFIHRGLRHGHTFLQLCDIRGYQNLMYDMADEEENLTKLIKMVEEFNLFIIEQYLDIGVDMMGYAEDLGMQNAPMISPAHFRDYIKPSYTRLIKPAKDRGVMIHMHSDGHLHDLTDDIIGSGVEVINLQDLVNGIDWIKERFAGKVCIDLDLDRQLITPNGTPDQIDKLIREEVEELSCKEGGLMMIYGLYPGVPLQNVKAIMDAMERYAFYH